MPVDAAGFAVALVAGGFAVVVVVAVLVVTAVDVVALDTGAGVVVAVLVAVAVVDGEWPPIIPASLWQPPSVSIKAAAQTIIEARMVKAPVNSPVAGAGRTGMRAPP